MSHVATIGAVPPARASVTLYATLMDMTRVRSGTFAPVSSALKALDEIVRFYINFEYDYDFVMRIRKIDIPARIKLGGKPRPTIGWNTWLLSKVGSKESGAATVDIPVSKRRLI